jgi:tetratricopeptide (TPR) repeat protein
LKPDRTSRPYHGNRIVSLIAWDINDRGGFTGPATRGYAVKGDQDKAIADYTEAVRLKPENARAYFNRGIAYKAKGDLDKAEQDLTKAKALWYVPKRTANQGLSV